MDVLRRVALRSATRQRLFQEHRHALSKDCLLYTSYCQNGIYTGDSYGFDPLNRGEVQVSTFYSSSLYGLSLIHI